MFCPKCGDPVDQNEKYCNKCGNILNNNTNLNYNNNVKIYNDNNKMVFVGIGIGIIFLLIVFVSVFILKSNKQVYFSNNSYEEEQIVENKTTTSKGKYNTVIITDKTYEGVKISSVEDANELIIKDSISQKDSCPSKIKEIENNIIEKYNVTAVNLCELDIEVSKEIEKVFDKIYKEYPSVRGYLTNFAVYNTKGINENPIAVFMAIFPFATSDSSSTYPWVIKTQILLNTKYFLNLDRLDSAVKGGSENGHFPKNATRYSVVAHELGHYLSFIATMKKHNNNSILLIDNQNYNIFYDVYNDFGNGDFSLTMIKEAFQNYKKDNNTNMTLDEWRATISAYAVAKDESGNYIYDETIAEAFHDVYLNGDKARDASKYVVEVLKQKLES